jgi:hypothetical protein
MAERIWKVNDLATTRKREERQDSVKWMLKLGKTGSKGAEWGEKAGELSRLSKEKGMNGIQRCIVRDVRSFVWLNSGTTFS